MLNVPKERIIEKLNAYTKDALQRASELCIEQSAYEVGTAHYIRALMEQPASDANKILVATKVNLDALLTKIQKSFDFVKKGSTELPQFAAVLLELLQDAWMVASASLDQSEITTGAILIAISKNPDRYCHYYFFSEFADLDGEGIINQYADITRGSMEGGGAKGADASAPMSVSSESALSKFGRDITAEAEEGKIDPVFCRDDEIALMTDVLCRRRKNNPILVGDPGVGKTAVAEGLALKIIENDVPAALQNAKLWELDLGALQAGASVKGEFERRLKAVLDEVLNSAEKIILFIDEAHTLIGGGGQAGGSDAANLLKPALARGTLRAIAATTWSEYKKYFEKDPALTRRFHVVKLDEPSVDQSVSILRGLRDKYEQVHNVYISDAALYSASSLSDRYMTGRQLPDKALDVLDTACVRVAAAQTAKPKMLDVLEKKIQLHIRANDALDRDALMRSPSRDDHKLSPEALEKMQVEADALKAQWEHEKEMVNEIVERRVKIAEMVKVEGFDKNELQTLQLQVEDRLEKLKTLHEKGTALVEFEVGHGIVAKIISDWTGVPAGAMSDDDAHKILKLGERIGEVIQGQDHAIEIIHDRLKAARLDFTHEKQPLGVFFLVGTSGVGKTETAIQVAEHLYGGEQFMTTINMSEYQEKHSVSRLIGSPPGYVGYGEGGVLTEAIRKMPYSVVLLDEVEKAHPDVLNIFYQAFDKGEIFDGEGREINCKNVVFFLTSNLGSEALMQNKDAIKDAGAEALDKAIRPHLEQHFKPALLARMRILTFKPLDDATMKQIVSLKIGSYSKRLMNKRRLAFEWDADLEEAILGLCAHAENGARMVDQVIDRWLIPPIAEESLQRMTTNLPLEKVIAKVVDGGIDLEFLPKPTKEKAPKKAKATKAKAQKK